MAPEKHSARKLEAGGHSPESPSVAEVPLIAVGRALVLACLVANTQCAETGLRVRPRGTALLKVFICREGTWGSALSTQIKISSLIGVGLAFHPVYCP